MTNTPHPHADLYAEPQDVQLRETRWNGRDLWVKQRPFLQNWAIQARVSVNAKIGLTPRVDPALILSELVRETVTESNFGLTPDSVFMIKDKAFGVFLCKWLGVYELLDLVIEKEPVTPKGPARSSRGPRGTQKSRSA